MLAVLLLPGDGWLEPPLGSLEPEDTPVDDSVEYRSHHYRESDANPYTDHVEHPTRPPSGAIVTEPLSFYLQLT